MKRNLKILFYISAWILLFVGFCLGTYPAHAAFPMQEGTGASGEGDSEIAENFQTRRVKVNFFINSIRAINDEAGTYEMDFWLELFWQDSALEGQVIEDIPIEKLWDPKIQAINGQAVEVLYRNYDNSFEPDTNVALYQHLAGTFHHAFDLGRFPFDQQWITIELESSELTSNRLLLDFIDLTQAVVYSEQPSIHPISTGKFVSSDVSMGEWSMAGGQVVQQIHVLPYDKSSWAQMRIEIQIVRNYRPYVLKIMLVLFFVMLLGIAIFFVDLQELRYRLLILFTLLLAVVTFDFTRLQSMPRVAYLTLIDVQVLLCYLLMLLIAGVILGTKLLARRGYEQRAGQVNRFALIAYGLFLLSINIGLWFYATYG